MATTISPELSATLNTDQREFLENLGKNPGFRFLHPKAAELIDGLKKGQSLFLSIGGSYFELKRLEEKPNTPVDSCFTICPPPPNYHCC